MMTYLTIFLGGNVDLIDLILHTDTKIVILLVLLLLSGPLFH